MPKRDWFGDLVPALVALATFVCILATSTALLLSEYAKIHDANAAYQKNAEHDRSAASEEIAEACEERIGSAFGLCIAEHLEAYYTDQAANKDLQAQQDMAFWAGALFISSTGLTAIGLFLLWHTLNASRSAAGHAKEMVLQAEATTKAAQESVVEARKATKFAEATADLSRQSLQTTDRAWVGADVRITEPLIFGGGMIKIGATVTVRNIGRSPATHVRILFSLYPDVVAADAAARQFVRDPATRGSPAISLGLGRVLFPDERYSVDAVAEMLIDKFVTNLHESRKLGAESDPPYKVDFVRPALLAGVQYALPGDRVFRYTLVPYKIAVRDPTHPGWDGRDSAFLPNNIIIEEGHFTGGIC